MSKLFNTIVRLLGVCMLFAGLLASPVNAQSNQPPVTVTETGEGVSAANSSGKINLSQPTSGASVAAAATKSFDWSAPVYYRKSDGLARPHLILTNMVGITSGDIITGTVGGLTVNMPLKAKNTMERKFGEIAMSPGSKISWKLYFNGSPFPEFEQTVNPSPVILTPNWPDAPAYCQPAVKVHNDPGVKGTLDGREIVNKWYNDVDFDLGPWMVDTTVLHHVLDLQAAHSINQETNEWMFNSSLHVEWDADCGIPHNPPPTSAQCDSISPTNVALKPGEKVLFTLSGTRVVTYEIALDGQAVSNSNTYEFTAAEVGNHTISGKVAGEDGKFVGGDACTTQIVITTTPPPHVPTSAVCGSLSPSLVALLPGQKQLFTLTGTGVVTYEIALDGQPVSQTKSYEFVASDVMTHTLTGKVAGEDGKFVSGPACVAGIIVSQNPPPIVPPTVPPTTRMRIEAINGLACVNYTPTAMFGYIGTWGAEASNARLMAQNDPSLSVKARALGREVTKLTPDLKGILMVNMDTSSVSVVLAPNKQTREVRWFRVGEPWYNESEVIQRMDKAVMGTLSLYADGSLTTRQITPVQYPSAEWLADPQNGCVRPPHKPENQQISVCTGRNPDGSKKYELFDLGSEPAEAASCQDTTPAPKNFCAKVAGVDTTITIDANAEIPVHLPCTLGEVNEAEANMIIFAQDMGALSAAALPLLGLVMLTGLLAIRRRYAL